jgi:hypothetical protein
VLNIQVIDALASAISLRGCYDQIIDGCTVYGMRSVRAGFGVYGGNAIEMGPWWDGDVNTYTGPYGNGRVTNNLVLGSTRASFPDTVVNNHLDTCNIGIQIQLGARNPDSRQQQQLIASNNTVRKCQYGIVIEGQNSGGAGDGVVFGNDVASCIYGVWFYANAGSNPSVTDNSYSVIIASNRISDTYAIPLAAYPPCPNERR